MLTEPVVLIPPAPCAKRTAQPPAALRASGFSLLELLVVVALIGVLIGVIMVTAFGGDRKQIIKTDAQRLALAIELARGEALSSNESWGLFVEEMSYVFAKFDEIELRWIEIEDGPFGSETIKAEAQFELHTEALNGGMLELGGDDAVLPDIVIYASGEQTPFEIELLPAWDDGVPWIVRSDGVQRTRALQFEDELADLEAEF